MGRLKRPFWEARYWLRSHPLFASAAERRPKVFCIGLHKTGTTSLELALKELGFRMGNQRKGELLLEDWAKRDFRQLRRHCFTADAFQDTPFSLPETYRFLAETFPNAKFILSVRDSAQQWYESLTRFHSKLWADGERIPTKADLQNAKYIYRGRPWEANRLIFGTPEHAPYHRDTLLEYYESHLQAVRNFFGGESKRFTEINISNPDDYLRLCQFLSCPPKRREFPWQNRTVTSDATMELPVS